MILPLSIRAILEQFAGFLRLDLGETVRRSAQLVGIWLLAWLAIRLIVAMARRIERAMNDGDDGVVSLREKRGKTITQLFVSVGRTVVATIAVLSSLNLFFDIAPLLGGAAILGLAVSFGAQSLVKDFLSGFFILVENQFALGDVIEAGGKSGVVEKITLRIVVLRDLEGAVHIVPNGEIKAVTNRTRGWSRAVVDIGVPYGEDVDRAIGVLRDEAMSFAADPRWAAQLDGPIEVTGVESLGESSLTVRVLARTQPGSQWSVGRELRKRLRKRLDAERIQLAMPQRRVHVTVSGDAGAGANASSAAATAAATNAAINAAGGA